MYTEIPFQHKRRCNARIRPAPAEAAFHGLDNFSVLLRCECNGTFIHVEKLLSGCLNREFSGAKYELFHGWNENA